MSSAAAMRDELYAHCRDSGLVDEIKTTLRARLISRLYQRPPAGHGGCEGAEDRPHQTAEATHDASGVIWERVAVSLFCDYLRSSGLPYTLSVFQPEVGAHRKVAELSREEILHVLNLTGDRGPRAGAGSGAAAGPLTSLGRRVCSDEGAGVTDGRARSLAESLLEGISVDQRRASGNDAGTQTWTVGEATLSSQLTSIDDNFRAKVLKETRAPYEMLEERMSEYRRECDARVEAEVELRTRRIREVEVSAVRTEEAARYRSLAEDLRLELEDENTKRAEALRRREDASLASLRAREARLEAEAYKQRQQALAEREDLGRVRESLAQERETFIEAKSMQERELLRREEAIRTHEADLEAMAAQGVGAADEVLMSRRTELEREFRTRTQALEEERRKVERDRTAAMNARSEAEADLARSSIDRKRAEIAEKAAADAEERCVRVRTELLSLRSSLTAEERDVNPSAPPADAGSGAERPMQGALDAAGSDFDALRESNRELKRALHKSLQDSEQARAELRAELTSRAERWEKRAAAAEEMLQEAVDGREEAVTHAEELRLELKRALRASAGGGGSYKGAEGALVPAARGGEDPASSFAAPVDDGLIAPAGGTAAPSSRLPDTLDALDPTSSSTAAAAAYEAVPELVRDALREYVTAMSDAGAPTREDGAHRGGGGSERTELDADVERRLDVLEEEEQARRIPIDRLKDKCESSRDALEAEMLDIARAGAGAELMTVVDRGDAATGGASEVQPADAPSTCSNGSDVAADPTCQPSSVAYADGSVSSADGPMGGADGRADGSTAGLKAVDALSPTTEPSAPEGQHTSPPGIAPVGGREDDGAASPCEGVDSQTSPVPAAEEAEETEVKAEVEAAHDAPTPTSPDARLPFNAGAPSSVSPIVEHEAPGQATLGVAHDPEQVQGTDGRDHSAEAAVDDEVSAFHGVSIIEKCDDEDDEDDNVDIDGVEAVEGQPSFISAKADAGASMEVPAAVGSPAPSRLQPLVKEDADEVEERLGSPGMNEDVNIDDSLDSIGRLEVLPPELPEVDEFDAEAELEEIDYDDIPMELSEDFGAGAGGHELDADISVGSFGQPQSSTSEGSVF